MHMNSPISQFSTSGTMGIYEASRHIWGESFKPDSSIYSGTSIISEADEKLDIATEEAMHENLVTLRGSDQEASKPSDKVLRRLAQNREAARKSRLRKKAYVQQLESSRLKLTQIEQEIDRARQQGLYISASSGDSSGSSGIINTGVVVFEMEYQHWVEEQNRQTSELRSALQAHDSDLNLRMLVESGLAHYDDLFRMKASAANSDVFHLLSGMWRTPAERFFLWIGGFRPSELLKILTPQLEPLTEQQVMAVCTLQQSSREAEDALSQGMDKLQQTLAETLVAAPPVGLSSSTLECVAQLTEAMRNLEALANFVVQADNLRQQTLQRMYRILTTRQAARGLLILGDYFQRLRALSSLWTARPREPT